MSSRELQSGDFIIVTNEHLNNYNMMLEVEEVTYNGVLVVDAMGSTPFYGNDDYRPAKISDLANKLSDMDCGRVGLILKKLKLQPQQLEIVKLWVAFEKLNAYSNGEQSGKKNLQENFQILLGLKNENS